MADEFIRTRTAARSANSLVSDYSMQLAKIINMVLVFSASIALVGCDPWRQFKLKDPKTGAEAVCAVHRGTLSDEEVQRVRGCIDACTAKGFQVQSPAEVPAARPPVMSAKPASIPSACR